MTKLQGKSCFVKLTNWGMTFLSYLTYDLFYRSNFSWLCQPICIGPLCQSQISSCSLSETLNALPKVRWCSRSQINETHNFTIQCFLWLSNWMCVFCYTRWVCAVHHAASGVMKAPPVHIQLKKDVSFAPKTQEGSKCLLLLSHANMPRAQHELNSAL